MILNFKSFNLVSLLNETVDIPNTEMKNFYIALKGLINQNRSALDQNLLTDLDEPLISFINNIALGKEYSSSTEIKTDLIAALEKGQDYYKTDPITAIVAATSIIDKMVEDDVIETSTPSL